MLEGLETIDWEKLTHAHGVATDVPRLLECSLVCAAKHRPEGAAQP
jgi:hypothetical protein